MPKRKSKSKSKKEDVPFEFQIPAAPEPERPSVAPTTGSADEQQSAQPISRKDIFFIIPRTVQIFYGPYMYLGMMDYRAERLQGLKIFLEKLGVTVELKQCLDHVNLARIWFLEEHVYSCKVTDLVHGGDGELDPICWEAANILEKFIRKILHGLRLNKAITPEELKRPFCPCFQSIQPQQQALVASKRHEVIGQWDSGSESDSKASTF